MLRLAGRPALHVVALRDEHELALANLVDALDPLGAIDRPDRADLVALYFMPDPKLVEWKLMPDANAFKAEYDQYIRNGLLQQLRRLPAGADIEEDHMRNRQLVAAWAFEKGKKDNVIEQKVENGKTFFVVKILKVFYKFHV